MCGRLCACPGPWACRWRTSAARCSWRTGGTPPTSSRSRTRRTRAWRGRPWTTSGNRATSRAGAAAGKEEISRRTSAGLLRLACAPEILIAARPRRRRYPTVTLMSEIDESIEMIRDNLTSSFGAGGASLEEKLASVRSILLLGAGPISRGLTRRAPRRFASRAGCGAAGLAAMNDKRPRARRIRLRRARRVRVLPLVCDDAPRDAVRAHRLLRLRRHGACSCICILSVYTPSVPFVPAAAWNSFL